METVDTTSYSISFVGKLRKKSKIKHLWVLEIASEPVEIVYFDSRASGKARVYLNSKEPFSSKRRSKTFNFEFDVKGYPFTIQQVDDLTELLVNDIPFRDIKKFKENMASEEINELDGPPRPPQTCRNSLLYQPEASSNECAEQENSCLLYTSDAADE